MRAVATEVALRVAACLVALAAPETDPAVVLAARWTGVVFEDAWRTVALGVDVEVVCF
ncbi:MAG TPA: hypothetical protein VM684_01580 [Gaiellales bacterium]|nr:hypothetical protein [Gaiellales bacterium]